MAVVTSKMTIPVDKSVSIQAVAEALGVGEDEIGFPDGSDPLFAYTGKIGLDTVTLIDTSSGKIFSTYSLVTATYTETITHWPSTLPEVPVGEVETHLTFSVLLRQQSPEEASQDKSGKPEKSTGADASPSPSGAG